MTLHVYRFLTYNQSQFLEKNTDNFDKLHFYYTTGTQ